MTIIYKHKILLLGAAAVGKTSLLHRFVDDDFQKNYASTIGVQFKTKEVNFNPDKADKDQALLTIWDVGGQSRFIDLRTTFYRGSNGALLIFDLTRNETFVDLSNWHSEMTEIIKKEIPFVIIGNKSDLKGRKVKSAEIEAFVKDKNSIYVETSAMTGKNVEKAFLDLTNLMIYGKIQESEIKPTKKQAKKQTKKKGGSSYIVKNKIRDYIKSKGCNTASSLLNDGVIDNLIIEILDKAIERAIANGRKTVQSKDI